MTTVRAPLEDLRLPARRSRESPALMLPPPAGGGVDVLLIAGEHSGDEQAARMLRRLRAEAPALRIAALGGPLMEEAGAQLLHDLTASSVVGLVEVLRNYGYFRALFRETLTWIERHRPRAVLFVDYPGFNLRMAAALRERGLSVKGGGRIRTLFYISPQIWAWKAGRRFTMARDLDALATIFPFEPACYADTALPVTFVGHPFVGEDAPQPVRYDSRAPVLLLPGSRRQAVGRIFPVLLRGLAASGEPGATVIYPSAQIQEVLRAARPPANVALEPTGTTVPASGVLTSSGTMSLHCALAAIPGAIVYRANPMTYVIGRMLLKVPYLGIANLLLDEPMYPEYLQGAATPGALAREIETCRRDPARRIRTAEQAERLRRILTQPAGEDAARWLVRLLG
jgi:lipid-A-disaccharide synthase